MQYCSEYVTSQIDCGLILKKKRKKEKEMRKRLFIHRNFSKYLLYCIFGQTIVYSIKFWNIQGK